MYFWSQRILTIFWNQKSKCIFSKSFLSSSLLFFLHLQFKQLLFRTLFVPFLTMKASKCAFGQMFSLSNLVIVISGVMDAIVSVGAIMVVSVGNVVAVWRNKRSRKLINFCTACILRMPIKAISTCMYNKCETSNKFDKTNFVF